MPRLVPRADHHVDLGARQPSLPDSGRGGAAKAPEPAEGLAIFTIPSLYQERLTSFWPDRFVRLALFTLETHDLALSKLARNSPIDREDVARLARAAPLDPGPPA